MAEFPRGWTFTSYVGPSQLASITIPGSTGVVHVLDEIDATIAATTAAAAGYAVGVQAAVPGLSGGAYLTYLLLADAGGAIASSSNSLAGMGLAGPPGGAITVQFAIAAAPGYQQLLVLKGYDL